LNTLGGGLQVKDAKFVETRNCTFFGNRTGNSSGGAIYIRGTGVVTEHFNLTIVSNSAAGSGGGVYAAINTTNYIHNSIIAGNSAGSGGKELHAVAGCMLVATNSLIFGTTSGVTIDNCITGQDPKLLPPADNGGPTPTCALLTGSPCIGAANPATALALDQRGYARDAAPDMGAFEFGAKDSVVRGLVIMLR
jgi:hypothetical protein